MPTIPENAGSFGRKNKLDEIISAETNNRKIIFSGIALPVFGAPK